MKAKTLTHIQDTTATKLDSDIFKTNKSLYIYIDILSSDFFIFFQTKKLLSHK